MTPRRRRSSSARRASGATSSPSPGTSRPSRARPACATCSSTRSRALGRAASRRPSRRRRPTAIVDAWIEFETETGRGNGHLRLKDGKAWTLLTALRELKGHEEPRGPARPRGVEHGADPDRETWLERRRREADELGYETQPEVVIVGGGQGGIGLGARLRQLGVPTIIVERNERPGDSWRKRYKSLCLHDPVWYDHLPYIKFPENWPVFSPKDKIGDWLEMYTRVMELNYWGSTVAKRASYDEDAGEWELVVEREGEEVVLRPKQLVLAQGMSSKPNLPEIEGMDVFEGEQHHSSAHPGPDAYAGKRAVVIGSNNSAHDICAALWEHGADVTMVQRSSTHIVRSDTLMDVGLGALYSEAAVQSGITTEKADMIFASLPYRIMHEFQIPLYDEMRERDKDFYDRLAAAGFQLDWGEDGSGLFMKYLRRGSGYYIDVGASELVASGEIKLVAGKVARLTRDAVVMEDGTELPADLVVYATGYGSMNGHAADLISQEVADRVGKVWGLGSDTREGPGPVGGRAAQHVEADRAARPVVPRRQPAPVAPLLALPRAPAQGPRRGHRHPGLRPAGGPPPQLSGASSTGRGSGAARCCANIVRSSAIAVRGERRSSWRIASGVSTNSSSAVSARTSVACGSPEITARLPKLVPAGRTATRCTVPSSSVTSAVAWPETMKKMPAASSPAATIFAPASTLRRSSRGRRAPSSSGRRSPARPCSASAIGAEVASVPPWRSISWSSAHAVASSGSSKTSISRAGQLAVGIDERELAAPFLQRRPGGGEHRAGDARDLRHAADVEHDHLELGRALGELAHDRLGAREQQIAVQGVQPGAGAELVEHLLLVRRAAAAGGRGADVP